MSLVEELAECRARFAKRELSAEDAIDAARWKVKHPDTGLGERLMLAALVDEIDRLRARCRMLTKVRVMLVGPSNG